MGDYYKMTGSQGPGSRIESVRVEDATEDHPEKVIHLDGAPVELLPYQVDRISRYVRLERVPDYDPTDDENALVEQPGISAGSSSTERPPVEPAPNVDVLDFSELRRLATDEQVEGRANKNESELRELVRNHLAQKEG